MPALAHDRSGSGEPLLLVHGLGSRRQAWKPAMDLASARRDVVTVDLPGFGDSPPARSGTALTVAGYADHLQAFLAELRLERPHIAGSSLGGAIALELGRRGAARSVTAFSPVGFWGGSGQAWCQWALRAGYELGKRRPQDLPESVIVATSRPTLFIYAFGRPWNAPAQEVLETVTCGLGAPAFLDAVSYALDFRFDRPQELRDIPLTIAWGRRDVLMPAISQARRARSMLPWARHVSLPRCGHVPFYDDPELCAAVLLRGSGG